MRLLHTGTYELRIFLDPVPPYAILSHTWGEEEVTFKDHASEARIHLKGWSKVTKCCELAAADGWEWVWIDTCCIDKSDSSELSEAINSMLRWYGEAQICYAYLGDVPARVLIPPELMADSLTPKSDGHGRRKPRGFPWKWYFRSSLWFTRGWTLQELLAPSFLRFVDASWGTIGSREEWVDEISAATGIEPRHLLDFQNCSLATKLSWAANRRTTREEDRAYSLLGLLGVNMPLIYGEGKRAFVRLQHELIRSYNDESILAWGTKDRYDASHVPIGEVSFLASSLEDFSETRGLVAWPFDKGRRGFATSNAGLTISTEVFEGQGSLEVLATRLYAIQLNCTWSWHSIKSPVQLFLTKMGDGPVLDGSVFCRASSIVRPWRVASAARTWWSLGRHNIIIADKAEEPLPYSSTTVTITDAEAELSLLHGHLRHKYFLNTLTRRWVPLIIEDHLETGMWVMSKRYIQKLSESEVLMARGGAFLMGFRVVFKGENAQEVEYLPIDAATPDSSAKRFGVVVKLTSHFPVFGIWRLERDSGLESLAKVLDLGTPYPASAPLEQNTVIRIESEPKSSDCRDSATLKSMIYNCNGINSFISPKFHISVAKSFFLRIKKECVRREHYQIETLGTVLFPVPCPLVLVERANGTRKRVKR